MDLKQLSALVAVAENGSFSAAARAIHTVQSNVSTHIARLERELQVTLIDRQTGELTEEGVAALGRARRILSELDALSSDVAALRDEVIGGVRAGVIGSIGRWLVPVLLRRLTEVHPKVHAVVVDASTTSLVPQLLDGTLEVALVNLPLTDPDLTADPLFEEDRVLVVPPDHPLADRDKVTIEEVAGFPLVLEPPGTAFRDELDAFAAEAGVTLWPQAEIDGMLLVASLAFRGFGAAILPATAASDRRGSGSWVQIEVDGIRRRSVGLARRKSGRLAAPARAFSTLVHEVVAEQAPTQPGVTLLP